MADKLELAFHFEPFIPISKAVTTADALTMIQNASRDFVVIVEIDNQVHAPQTLVRAEHLANLVDAKNLSLAEVLAQLPPLVAMDGEQSVLDSGNIKQLSLLLARTDAPGVVVYQDKQIKGVVSLETIVDALPLSAIPSVSVKGLYGNSVTLDRDYICHKCEQSDPPPPYSPYRGGYAPPVCPKHPFLHGAMEREDI
jgi:hypothetical protein